VRGEIEERKKKKKKKKKKRMRGGLFNEADLHNCFLRNLIHRFYSIIRQKHNLTASDQIRGKMDDHYKGWRRLWAMIEYAPVTYEQSKV
jgi:hypothetical protein